jgi:hypothetical protein
MRRLLCSLNTLLFAQALQETFENRDKYYSALALHVLSNPAQLYRSEEGSSNCKALDLYLRGGRFEFRP